MNEILAMLEYCSLAELNQIQDAIRKAKKKFPTQPKVKAEAASDPVIEFRLKCHRLCVCWLNEHGHECHAWDGLQRKGLNGIIDKIKFSLSKREGILSEKTVLQSFEGFMSSLPDFYANKIDFDLFDRRFNAIVSEIRASKNGRTQITDSQPGFTTRFEKAAQRIAERHAAGQSRSAS